MRRPRCLPRSTPVARSLSTLALVFSTLAGCGGIPAPNREAGADLATGATAEIDAAPGTNVETYAVTGVVVYLPSESVPAVTIRHQAIDEFVDMDGDVVGMPAMTMPFPVADGVSLDGIEEGDPVRFTLEVEWEGDPPYRVAQVEKAAAGK